MNDELIHISEDGYLELPPLIDAHTHCADAGVHPPQGMSLWELVAPPDGLKHRYLRDTPRETLVRDMAEFSERARSNGIAGFVDFREGGPDGCRMLREASPHAFILGRPVSPSFNSMEMDELLSVADGLGLPSISDMGEAYIEKCAEAAHAAGKPFAIHVSERVREDIETILGLDPAFVVHMVQSTDADLRACADAGVPVVVCPRSNRYFGMEPPVVRMLDAGVAVSIGTDNAMLCSPDLRPEALIVSEMLGKSGRDPSDAIRILASGSETVRRRIGMETAEKHTRIPVHDGNPLSTLTGDGPVQLL